MLFFFISCTKEPEIDSLNWYMYSGDPSGSKYSELDEINKENVGNLKVAWTYKTGDMRESPPTTIQCNPIIIDETMYLTTPALKVIALHAATGKEIWRFDPYEGEGSFGENRGVVYWTDGVVERIFYVAGSWLYSLQARSGNPVLNFGDSGKVDLYEGMGREIHHLWITAATPGIIYKDMLIPLDPGWVKVPDRQLPVTSGHLMFVPVRFAGCLKLFHNQASMDMKHGLKMHGKKPVVSIHGVDLRLMKKEDLYSVEQDQQPMTIMEATDMEQIFLPTASLL
ncbi:hypothetical protein ACFLU5_17360 [Bacteroidota bacterium]